MRHKISAVFLLCAVLVLLSSSVRAQDEELEEIFNGEDAAHDPEVGDGGGDAEAEREEYVITVTSDDLRKIAREIAQQDRLRKQEQQADKADIRSGPANVPSAQLTPGDEFTDEKPKQPYTKEAIQKFETALRFMQRGHGLGTEGRRAAFKLFDAASAMGHLDAKKIMAFAHLFGDRARFAVDEARQAFQELADDGSADAQLGLGFMHATGIGMPESSQAKALVFYSFAALAGNPLAQMAIAYRYHLGVGVAPNCEKALYWYKRVADRVASRVRFVTSQAIHRTRLADEIELMAATASPMDTNLFEYYKFLADKGDTTAQVGLGQLYLTGGRGVEQDFAKALSYFQKAMTGGSASAAAWIGRMYLDGTLVTPASNVTAFELFQKSADKKHHMGQAGLGIMYLQGRAVEQNFEKAARLFNQAAEQGSVEAQLQLGVMFHRGLGLKRDFGTAIKYFQMSSQNGHLLAFYNLANMHASGIGVPRSCNTAVELFKNVAERGRWAEKMHEAYTAYKEGRHDEAALKYLFLAELGSEPAQSNFAFILDRGETTIFPRDELRARALTAWQRAANQDYAAARVKLGDYHYYGWGTPPDYELAAQHYKLAAEKHAAAQAMFNLGYMHERGLGLARDIHLAKRFYDQAAETSADAWLPVYLALAKLSLLFAADYINQNPLVIWLESTLGAQWDVVAMAVSLLAMTLAGLYIVKQQRARGAAFQQVPAQQDHHHQRDNQDENHLPDENEPLLEVPPDEN